LLTPVLRSRCILRAALFALRFASNLAMLLVLLVAAALALTPAAAATLRRKYNTANKRVDDGRVNVHIIRCAGRAFPWDAGQCAPCGRLGSLYGR